MAIKRKEIFMSAVRKNHGESEMSDKMVWELEEEVKAGLMERSSALYEYCQEHKIGLFMEMLEGECEDGLHSVRSFLNSRTGQTTLGAFLGTSLADFVRENKEDELSKVIVAMYETHTSKEPIRVLLRALLGL